MNTAELIEAVRAWCFEHEYEEHWRERSAACRERHATTVCIHTLLGYVKNCGRGCICGPNGCKRCRPARESLQSLIEARRFATPTPEAEDTDD